MNLPTEGNKTVPIRDWRLYLVADVDFAGEIDLVAKTWEAVRAGVNVVQLRAKSLEPLAFLETSFRMAEMLKPRGIPLIINDRVDIARACKAEGVHLGQSDMPLEEARGLLGPEAVIGVSVCNVTQARHAEAGGADYIAASPVFPTASKTDLDPALGLQGLRALREAVSLPIIAIGGINADNAAQVIGAGASGLAVISAILGADDAGPAARALLRAIDGEV
jgi:thiamine-phosphate pyrophosphorylase